MLTVSSCCCSWLMTRSLAVTRRWRSRALFSSTCSTPWVVGRRLYSASYYYLLIQFHHRRIPFSTRFQLSSDANRRRLCFSSVFFTCTCISCFFVTLLPPVVWAENLAGGCHRFDATSVMSVEAYRPYLGHTFLSFPSLPSLFQSLHFPPLPFFSLPFSCSFLFVPFPIFPFPSPYPILVFFYSLYLVPSFPSLFPPSFSTLFHLPTLLPYPSLLSLFLYFLQYAFPSLHFSPLSLFLFFSPLSLFFSSGFFFISPLPCTSLSFLPLPFSFSSGSTGMLLVLQLLGDAEVF